MTIQETAALLQTMDRVLLLTHVRPDGDTIGSAAALCRALRDLGKTAYLLPNPGITETYACYAAPYWAEEGFEPDFVAFSAFLFYHKHFTNATINSIAFKIT